MVHEGDTETRSPEGWQDPCGHVTEHMAGVDEEETAATAPGPWRARDEGALPEGLHRRRGWQEALGPGAGFACGGSRGSPGGARAGRSGAGQEELGARAAAAPGGDGEGRRRSLDGRRGQGLGGAVGEEGGGSTGRWGRATAPWRSADDERGKELGARRGEESCGRRRGGRARAASPLAARGHGGGREARGEARGSVRGWGG